MELKPVDYILMTSAFWVIVYSLLLIAQENVYKFTINDLKLKCKEQEEYCEENHYVLYRWGEEGQLEVEPKK